MKDGSGAGQMKGKWSRVISSWFCLSPLLKEAASSSKLWRKKLYTQLTLVFNSFKKIKMIG